MDERLIEVARVLDEALGYSVPYRKSRYMGIDSAFTHALRRALGVPPTGSAEAFLRGQD